MTAADHLSQQQQPRYLHGTNARLSPGDDLTPGHGSNFGVSEDKSFVHVTTSHENARGYADWAAGWTTLITTSGSR
jgi:hypothetical protein